jgi:hypothetical protein
LFLAALRKRARRLPFEVEDVEISFRPEDLAQVVVTVNADLRGGELQRRRPVQLFEQQVAAFNEPFRPPRLP